MEYSVSIRTVAPNPHTDRLLQSLMEQSFKPTEIDIVLPHNNNPNEKWIAMYPNIRFIQSIKGMIAQRATGIKEARFKYVLLLDDDIVFTESDAIERLFSQMLKHDANMALPYSPEAFPKGNTRFIHHLFGIAVPTTKRYLSYTPGGGYYYPKKVSFEQPYEVEGGRGCCIAADRDFLLKYGLYGDPELERINYALREDGAFVADIARHGGKAILVGNVSYEHLGVERKINPKRLYHSYEASVFNNYLFWRKYVKVRYRQPLLPQIAFGWHVTGVFVFALLVSLKYNSFQPILGALKGLRRIAYQLRKNKR